MTKIKQTKTKTYINFNGEVFITNNSWEDKTIVPVDMATMNEQQKAAINTQYGWEEIGEHEDVQSAYYAYIGMLIERKAERKVKNDILAKEFEDRKTAEWNAIKDLPIIPATMDNVRIVLGHLHSTNWGGWKLPAMSIGYSAAQYDCDGITATTMKFDSPIEGEKMFKVGGKSGHLNKYQSIRI